MTAPHNPPDPAQDPAGEWAAPLGPPTNGDTHPPVTVRLSDPAVDAAVTIGPGDLLVVRVRPMDDAELDQVADRILRTAPGQLRGRVLVVAAEQIAAVRG